MVISNTRPFGTGQMGGSVSILYRQGAAYLTAKLKQHGLGAGQHASLLIIADNDGLRQEDLVRILHVDKAHVARAVQKLAELGFIRREADPGDQRARTLHATEKAHEIIPVIHAALRSWNDIVMRGMSAQEQETLVRLLSGAAANAAQHSE